MSLLNLLLLAAPTHPLQPLSYMLNYKINSSMSDAYICSVVVHKSRWNQNLEVTPGNKPVKEKLNVVVKHHFITHRLIIA